MGAVTEAEERQRDKTHCWTVRFTWEVLRGPAHPEHTYQTFPEESWGVAAAISALSLQQGDSAVLLVAAQIKGPWPDEEWRVIFSAGGSND